MASAIARARHIRISPRKVRLVADLIRGQRVSQARDILAYTLKAGAPVMKKVLASAVANAESIAAEQQQRIDSDEMIIKDVQVNEGPTMRRFRAAARGRGMRIRKRSCHIDLKISD